MNVGELILELQKLDKSKRVIQSLDGYWGEIKTITVTEDGDYMLQENDKEITISNCKMCNKKELCKIIRECKEDCNKCKNKECKEFITK